jgi:putative membrane protein
VAERDFYGEEARQRTTAAVRAVEAVTSAELVVEVRHVGGRYREADYLVGAVLAFVTLVVMLYAERRFPISSFPASAVLVFAVAAFASSRLPQLRRPFVSGAAMRRALHHAARAAFVDLGVSHTHGRTGMLVYVATFEGRAELVCDLGIPEARLGPGLVAIRARLDAAVRRRDFAAFESALRALGPLLEGPLPRSADDENELPDGPVVDEEDDARG